LFPRSDELTKKDGGVLFLLTQRERVDRSGAKQRLADAVAVAALGAAGRDRRRAAVVILGPAGAGDASSLDPAGVKRYLARLGVPLFVWCPGREADPSWGACRDVSTPGNLSASVKELDDELERQRIVWVEGTLLPHRVTLTGKASSISLV